MCGIVGWLRLDVNKHQHKLDDVLRDMLIIDTLRGVDSTGVFVKDYDSTNREWYINYHKEAIAGPEFVSRKTWNQLMLPQTNLMFAVGHNRAATLGKRTDENAHPFFTENLTGVHNGTLRGSWRADLHGGMAAEVDSEAIYNNIQKYGINDTVDKIGNSGAYSLVWYDDRDDTLNFLRNAERPMWFVQSADIIGFGSEKFMIAAAMERQGFKVTGFQELPANTHVAFDTSGQGKPAKVTFRAPVIKTYSYTPSTPIKDTTSVGGNRVTSTTVTVKAGQTTSITGSLLDKKDKDLLLPRKYPNKDAINYKNGELFHAGKTYNARMPNEAYPQKHTNVEQYIGKTIAFSVVYIEDKPNKDGKYKVDGEMVMATPDGVNISVTCEVSNVAKDYFDMAKVLFAGDVVSAYWNEKTETLCLELGKAFATTCIDPFNALWLPMSNFPLTENQARLVGVDADIFDTESVTC